MKNRFITTSGEAHDPCSRSCRVSVCNRGLVPVNANGLLTGARAAAAADAWCMGMPPLLLLLLILLRPAPRAADGRSMHVSRPPLRSLGFSPTSLRHVPKQRPDSLRIPAPRKASAGARLRLQLVLVSAGSGRSLVPAVLARVLVCTGRSRILVVAEPCS